jgi:hypothetical protein
VRRPKQHQSPAGDDSAGREEDDTRDRRSNLRLFGNNDRLRTVYRNAD